MFASTEIIERNKKIRFFRLLPERTHLFKH